MTEVDSKEVLLQNAQTDLMDQVYAQHKLYPVAAAGDHVLQSLCGVAQEKVIDLISWIREQDVDRGSAGTSLRALQMKLPNGVLDWSLQGHRIP
jgi:hypothetical protein